MSLRPSTLLRPLRARLVTPRPAAPPSRSLLTTATTTSARAPQRSAVSPFTLATCKSSTSSIIHQSCRYNSTQSTPASSGSSTPAVTPANAEAAEESAGEQARERPPSYALTFTCRPCQTRSTHEISKQAYHSGSVLVQCPGCKNRHVIADHLKIFGEKARTFEEILKDSGEILKHARLNENGDVEILPPTEEN